MKAAAIVRAGIDVSQEVRRGDRGTHAVDLGGDGAHRAAPWGWAVIYCIERELGAGGMATVNLAEDLKHDRPQPRNDADIQRHTGRVGAFAP